jgi:hypothetical protein
MNASALKCALLISRPTTGSNACGSEVSPAPVTSFTLPPSCRTSRRWRSVYSARQQVRCARRLPKWHGNPGEVFAEQAVTPSQEQVKTSPPASDLRQGIFRQHRSFPDLDARNSEVRFTPMTGHRQHVRLRPKSPRARNRCAIARCAGSPTVSGVTGGQIVKT